MTQKISIIGAGIGGLTLALALKRAGFIPTIYESAAEIKPVGAGIVMAGNAMQVFEKLGIRQKVEAAGRKISKLNITDAMLQPIVEVDLRRFEQRYGVCNIAIHRADLQSILAEEVGFQDIKLSKRLTKVEKNKDFRLTFEDGSTGGCDFLFGADGIHSQVRKQVFDIGKVRDTGQRCWRGVTKIGKQISMAEETFEAWGKGRRFGASQVNEEYLYWFAVINESLMEGKDIPTLFKDFHPDILKIISDTEETDIFFNKIIDLRPISIWQREGACLIGDAAHATTPNMGQGACQAVEDAYVLGELLKRGNDFSQAFQAYEKIRMKKAHAVVRNSWWVGKAAHFENSWSRKLRDTVIKATPDSLKNRQLEKFFNIDYF